MLLLAGCVGPWPEDGNQDTAGKSLDDVHIGFVYSSGIDDGGWAQTHHNNATEVAQSLGVPLSFRPAVASADVAEAIRSLLEDDGASIVYTTSSGYITDTLNAANANPEATFFSCCGKVSGDNITSYFGRIYQPIYVLGFVAGSMSCTERIGIVAALPLPQFVRHINAFTLGARRANPNIEVDVRFVGAFFNPAVEGALAAELMDRGSDVIFQQANSTAPLQERPGATASCERGGVVTETPVYRMGYHSPTACEANPSQCISSAHWNWTGLYEDQVLSIVDGSFDPTDTDWKPMRNTVDSVVNYAPLAPFVPQSVVAALAAVRNETVADPQMPFVGPLSDNTGAAKIAAGQLLSDADLERICWFVDGVITSNEAGDAIDAQVPSSCAGI